MEKVAANIQLINKENKYGRVSEFTLWGYQDLYSLLDKQIPSDQKDLILNKFISMMKDAILCFSKNITHYPLSHNLNKNLIERNEFLNEKEKTQIENYLYEFNVYRISMYHENYAKSYPPNFTGFSNEDNGMCELEKFMNTQGYKDFLFLKNWLNKNRKNKKLTEETLNRIIKDWQESKLITVSKIDIFIESYSYALFDASRNGHIDRYKECGILSNAMIFESEKRAVAFAKGKNIENNCYVVRLKIEVDSIVSKGILVENYANDFKESLVKRENNKVMKALKHELEPIEKDPKKRL